MSKRILYKVIRIVKSSGKIIAKRTGTIEEMIEVRDIYRKANKSYTYEVIELATVEIKAGQYAVAYNENNLKIINSKELTNE